MRLTRLNFRSQVRWTWRFLDGPTEFAISQDIVLMNFLPQVLKTHWHFEQ
jgi:hypothetical protein